MRSDLDEVKRLMIQFPVADGSFKDGSSNKPETQSVHRFVQCLSKFTAQRPHRLFLWRRCLYQFEFGQGDPSIVPAEDHRDDFFGYGSIVDQSQVLVGRCGKPQNPTKEPNAKTLQRSEVLRCDDILLSYLDDPSLGRDRQKTC